ncbi:MAG: ester cyclase [Nocardioidaceae bacterium]
MSDPAVSKELVRRLVEEVMNQRRLDVLAEIYTDRLAGPARRWIEPFLASFADVEMRIVDLVAEGDRVVGRFLCSGTHVGEWLGQAATGRRFHDVPEVYIFTVREGRIAAAWGVEDTWGRLQQLGLTGDDSGRSSDPA